MEKQVTINNTFEIEGVEPYGGNTVKLSFYPAEENTGIIFKTPNGEVKSSLDNCSEYKFSLLLKNHSVGVLHTEHLLATLYSYGVDNAIIKIKRVPSFSFGLLDRLGLATSYEVVPNFDKKTYGLCERLEGNLRVQNEPRKLLWLENIIGSLETEKLLFEPIQENGLIIKAITKYTLLGEQTVEVKIDAESYKSKISMSRPYAKHYIRIPDPIIKIIASLYNPSFGIGHGFDESNVFIPPTNNGQLEKTREIYKTGDEPARHTIMDRLGALALLPGRLDGIKVTAKFSGHSNDLKILRKILPYFIRR